ncbi:MAG: secondary thiamine-phosphate synthase enzyme YjbQ [Sphaerochaeta sp.]|nr:secondary thiamine-phosphate synthase enzyme YjbQ [Sphaerochaeta sp.]
MLQSLTIATPPEAFLPITQKVQRCVTETQTKEGYVLVFCPHTTAGLTINENADPDVVQDMLLGLRNAFAENSNFRHAEGNSTAHLKASAMGSSVMVPIVHGRLSLGIWQNIYFCEFDGPRTRTFQVMVVPT